VLLFAGIVFLACAPAMQLLSWLPDLTMMLKRLAFNKLPIRYVQWLRRNHYARQLRRGSFVFDAVEQRVISQLLAEGDWVIDLGANVGHYTRFFSAAVGEKGRVFALEPIPENFQLLAANSFWFPFQNVTLLNLAVSDCWKVVHMEIPTWQGMPNYYEGHITDGSQGKKALCCRLDDFRFAERIRLIKIDVEGHEMAALRGMTELLARDSPILIIETVWTEWLSYLADLGYHLETMPGSPNAVFKKK
jgi:FkbM family methyltransferase